jgi:hypothetical protein
MSELKDEIAAERDALRVEVENLRGQLTAAGTTQPGRAAPVQHTFQLSEGNRQELALNGVTNIGGRQMTRAQVAELLTDDQRNVELPEVDPDAATTLPPARANLGIPGVDYVWPSVAPGVIDPAVAGTPGINGPAATEAQVSRFDDAERFDRDAKPDPADQE